MCASGRQVCSRKHARISFARPADKAQHFIWSQHGQSQGHAGRERFKACLGNRHDPALFFAELCVTGKQRCNMAICFEAGPPQGRGAGL
jgi:hypothetical protein